MIQRHLRTPLGKLPLPQSRIGRTVLGLGLILGGTLGFLPILGFWMLPLGLAIVSLDFPALRRVWRRIALWWKQPSRGRTGPSPPSRSC